jgi:hypothetical protein
MMRFLDICIRLFFPVGQSDMVCVPVISPRSAGVAKLSRKQPYE